MSKVVRSVKNVTKGYSTVQIKVRNATSNDAWGPTGTEMSEIAQLSFNNSNDFHEIMDMLDKRLNDKGKNWRHVLKSLKVLDYCLHEGSEMVVTWARKNIYIVKTLREFQYIDEDGRDVGQNVRVSAKELTALIQDEDRLRSERTDRRAWKSRVTGIDGIGDYDVNSQPRRKPERRKYNEEDDTEYRLAIEASKNQAEEDKRKRDLEARGGEDDDDLAKAIKLSKEEEELRRRELEESNASSLFDDNFTQPQPTGNNQGYQQQPAVDWFGNPIDQQQPQSTGYLNNQYSQPTGFQTQPTGFQNGFNTGFQTQPTGFDQSQFQQQQQPNYLQAQNTLQPQSTIQPQTTAFGTYNPYAQQPNGFGDQAQQQQPQQPQQAQSFLQAGSNNPWATPSTGQPDSLKPAPTGSNNPFATFNRNQFQTQQPGPPTLASLQEQKTATQYTPSSNNPIFNYQPPQQQQIQQQQPQQQQPQQQQLQQQQQQQQQNLDPHHARLNALLASGEGQDTFGNVGDLRIPSQHTAPGTFVNSAGQGLGRLPANATGTNPFFGQSFTGMGRGMVPAQTGPVGYGGNSNPFGQRTASQPASGSLIDL
ncbi:MAG: hypothetical protein M1834_003093 [Cirrosporium novae-zelandiae]|nr:MAG: hypothetical protein M1834_003093 [Cirrosporium novae-zelandiae]